MGGLLEGVRVLDFTTVLAGPFAAYQLAMLGAEVIKVEMPGVGDLARELGDNESLVALGMGASFVAQNAGKKSVTLDLKSDRGKKVFGRLVATSDVLLENMRPEVLSRLGFDWERLNSLNPQLIYCSISGFGQTGPLATRPAYDQIIQGMSGMSDVTGSSGGDPTRIGFPICDTLGGFAAVMTINAALVRRSREGVGCRVDVSMLDTALTSMGWVVSEELISHRSATRHGNDNAASSPSGTFRTGQGLLNIAANTQRQFETVCSVLGLPELVHDDRFLTRALRKAHRAELKDELEVGLATKSAEEWESELAAASVPVGRVLTLAQALNSEQIRHRRLIHESEVEGYGSVSLVGGGAHIDGTPMRPLGSAPQLGEHNDEIFGQLGFEFATDAEWVTHDAH